MITETVEVAPVQAGTEIPAESAPVADVPAAKAVDEKILATLSRITAALEGTPEAIKSLLLNEVRTIVTSHVAILESKINLLHAAKGALSALNEIDAMEEAFREKCKQDTCLNDKTAEPPADSAHAEQPQPTSPAAEKR